MRITFRVILHLLPVAILGLTLLLLFFVEIPGRNHDIAIAIVGGLLGFLTKQSIEGIKHDV